MTDLNDRFVAMLEGEPPSPHDLDRVVSDGRRALRRRNTLTAVLGTAGTAAVAAAVVVPITVANHHHETTNKISVVAQPTPTPPPHCKAYLQKSASKAERRQSIDQLMKKADRHGADGTTITTRPLAHHITEVQVCPPGSNPAASPEPTTPPDPTSTMPPYHYDGDPQTIANGFESELERQVKKLGFAIVYSRPFAQETSKLEKGHPSYYDGNVDVQLPDGPADIGVQVTHAVTQQVPLDGECNPETCERTTLDDGSLMQVSRMTAGTGGGEVVAVEIHRPGGVVVDAQMSNYAFGPEATRDRTKHQPLTIEELKALAEDEAWTF